MDRSLRRPGLRVGAAAAVSAVALWLASRNAHIDGLRSAMAGATFLWLLPYPIICVVLNVIRGEIWRQLLQRRVGTVEAFWAYSVGFLANNVLPFRLGEAARVVVLSTHSGRPVVEVAAAAGLERLLDLAALSLMLALVAPVVARVPGLTSAALLIVAFVGIALTIVVALTRFRNSASAKVESVTRWLPEALRQAVAERWKDLTRGLAVLLKPRIGIPAAGASIVVWILTVVLQWLVLRAFQPAATAADAAFMVAAVSLAIALPAAPGFVGVYHWAGQQALVTAFPERYDASTALAAATVAHAVSYLTSTALGLIGLWYFGLPPSAVAGVVQPVAVDLSFADAHARDADSPAGIAN
jgi:glycosyltransferase 2 family protein